MNAQQFFEAIVKADNLTEFQTALDEFESHTANLSWNAVGGNENNRGVIEVSADPGRSLVERITNAIDAHLEREHEAHRGQPVCRTPKEAAVSWLNVPPNGLASMTARERQAIAKKTVIKLLPGEGKNSRVIEVRDEGIGIRAKDFTSTILSLNQSNKVQKHYLVGTYGQGGSSTFVSSRYSIIASRRSTDDPVAFTVVKYLDLPPEQFKTGRYVFLALDGQVLEATVSTADFPVGTSIRHLGFDLSKYPSPLGPSSLYGLLNQVLFDPIVPVWLDSRVHNYRRVIKGARNALNGAVDEGDEGDSSKLSHHAPMFHVSLGEFGRIGIEYWVLERTGDNKQPSASYVNPRKPIILTTNGQNQAELSALLVRKDASLPFLAFRLICHVDCDSLTPAAKRALFVSNREDARTGEVREAIENEVVRALASDEDLKRLNEEAKASLVKDRDDASREQMRKEVAKLLRTQGVNVIEAVGPSRGSGSGVTKARVSGPRRTPTPIAIVDPPTFLKIVGDSTKPLDFHPGHRRYIRVETDAPNRYHDPSRPHESKFNIVVDGKTIQSRGTTALQNGRMRLILECAATAAPGDKSRLRVELIRPGLPVLFDEREVAVIAEPPSKPGNKALTLPEFEIRPVSGPDDDAWSTLGWPENIAEVASTAVEEEGKLVIYYSEAFPRFERLLTGFAQRSDALAESFRSRYEVWLAAHAFLVQQESEVNPEAPLTDDDANEARDLAERCRIAVLASMFAAREVELAPTISVEGE